MEEKTIKPKKLPKLTKKQRGFVKDYVLSGNGQESALNNYEIEGEDKENIARSIASQNLTKLNVIKAIEIKTETLKSALEKKGITPEKIADKINVLLDAKDEKGLNDYTAIDKGLKHSTSIYGITPELPPNQSNITYNFLFSSETQDRIKAINEEIKANLITNEHNN